MTDDLVHDLRAYYLMERDIPQLYDGINPNIRTKYKETCEDLRIRAKAATGAFQMQLLMDIEESTRYAWEDLVLLRTKKIIKIALYEAETGYKSDISGALSWEKEKYPALVESIRALIQTGFHDDTD